MVSRRGPESPPFHSGPPPTPVPGPVSAVREHRKRAGRYVVVVGATEVGPVSVETIAGLGIRVGTVLEPAALARLVDASAATACYDRALDALARRARSTRDLERWLEDRDQPKAAIAHTVERLTALGLLDDLAYARAFARSKAGGKGFGPRRVLAELARHGVSRRTIDQAMDEVEHASEEEAPSGLSRAERERLQVREAAERRMRSLTKLDPDVARRRLVGWLVRRGYGAGIAVQVAREMVPRG